MTKKQWFSLSAVLILISILVQLFKLIPKLNEDLIDGATGAFLGVGIVFLVYTIFRRKKIKTRILLGFVVLFLCSCASNNQKISYEDLDMVINKTMQENKLPGLAIAIVKGGLSDKYGWCN